MIGTVTDSLKQALQENLSLYCTQQEYNGKDFFQTHREISIARFALSKQAESYFIAIDIFTAMLLDIQSQVTHDAKQITSILSILSNIESKSQSLLASARQVTELLGKAVNIDVDKANLKSMLLNLPDLVQSSITQVTGNDLLAQEVAVNLNAKISEMIVAFRFRDYTEQSQSEAGNPAITFEQFSSMINSVPTPIQSSV